ncbi:MAG TPA: hypothetical protein VLT33_18595, partial [Labilithrix sp.]|nr:hypothetical protein [Labilithrix sp.]
MAKHALLTLIAASILTLASGCAEVPEEASSADTSALEVGTPRRQRFVLLQAEVDGAQSTLFQGLTNATVVSSYAAGIYWAKPDAVPSVQDSFDLAIDTAIAKIDTELAAKERANAAYEETIFLGLAGHSTGASFFGHARTSEGNTNYARIAPERVKSLAVKYPHFAKNVRALLLLGCNAGHQNRMDLWRQQLPHVAAVAGFNSRAPSGINGSNVFVTRSIGAWQRLGILNAGASLTTDHAVLFKDLIDCRNTKCLGSKTETAHGSVVQGSPAWELIVNGYAQWDAVYPPDAGTLLPQIKTLKGEYDAYLDAADAAHADPPADTNTGLVRQYNNLAQQYLSALEREARGVAADDLLRVS